MSICCIIIIFINALKRLWVLKAQTRFEIVFTCFDRFLFEPVLLLILFKSKGDLGENQKGSENLKIKCVKISLYLHLIFLTSHLIYIVGVKSRAFKHIYPENENWKKLLEISFAYRTVNIFITSILDLCRIFRNSPQPPLATMTIAMSLGVDIACHVTAKYPSSAKYGRKVGSQLPRLPSQVMRKQNVGNTNRCPLTA